MQLERQLRAAEVLGVAGEDQLAGFEGIAGRRLAPAGTQLAEHTDVEAQAQLGGGLIDLEARDALTVLVQVAERRRRAEVDLGEPALRRVQWLVPLQFERAAAADLGTQQQLAAERVDPGALIRRAQAVGRARAQRRVQVDGQAQVVRPPALLHRGDAQHMAFARRQQAVVDALVPAVAVDAQQVAVEPRRVERRAGALAKVAAHDGGVGTGQAVDADLVDAWRHAVDTAQGQQPVGPVVGVERQRLQRRRHAFGGEAPALGRLRVAGEVAGAQAAEVGFDVDVARAQRLQRQLDVLLGEQGHHLGRHRQQRVDVGGGQQRRADVDGNDEVRLAQRAHFGHRQVVDQTAVDQLAAVDLGRRQQSGHRHARAHRLRQAAFAKHDALAAADVGGNDRQRQRQGAEVGFDAVGAHQLVDEELDLLPGDRARGIGHAVGAQAGLAARHIALQQALVAQVQLAVGGVVLEHVGPVGAAHGLAHGRGRHAGGPGAGDEGAHAGAGHAVDAHALALQFLEHANVRCAACAAATEHEADARTLGTDRWGGCRRRREPLQRQPGNGGSHGVKDAGHGRHCRGARGAGAQRTQVLS